MASLDSTAIIDAARAAVLARLMDEATNSQAAAFAVGVTAAELDLGKPGLMDPDAQAFAREFEYGAIQSFTADFARRVETEVTTGIRNGEGERDIAKRLRGLSDRSEARLNTIARTETNRAANHGRLSGWKKEGNVRLKQWLATNDDRVRDDHLESDGEVVPINSVFETGAAAGYDSPPAAPNCRCTIIPVTSFSEFTAATEGIPGLRRIEDRHAEAMVRIMRSWVPMMLEMADPLPQRGTVEVQR